MASPLRHSIRLREYDYTQPGAYFVTVVTDNRVLVLSKIVDGQIQLSPLGKIVEEELLQTSQIRPFVEIDAYVIMPNHVHVIFIINDDPNAAKEKAGVNLNSDVTSHTVAAHSCAPLQRQSSQSPAGNRGAPIQRLPRSLGSMIAGRKSITTKRANLFRRTPSAPLWQRNYYEHIIRSDQSLDAARTYILSNPYQWELDPENPTKK